MNDIIPQWPAPGVFSGVSETDYHRAPGMVSKSLLWDFSPNPHRWKFGPPKEQTGALAWGSMIDALWLAGSFDEDFIVSPYDEFRTNEAKGWRDAQTKTVVKLSELAAARLAAAALCAHPIASHIRAESDTQISVLVEGKEPQTGETFRAKGRIDLVPHEISEYSNWLFDLKTTRSVARHDIQSAIAGFGYHVQAALYLDLYNVASGDARSRFGFIFQESEPPYEIAVVELDPSDIEAGRAWYQKALALWCRCIRDGNWPSPWDDQIKVVSRPAWARKGDEE